MLRLKKTDPDFTAFFAPQKSEECQPLAAINNMPPMHQLHDNVECSWQSRATVTKTPLEEEDETRADGNDRIFLNLKELECN